MKDTTLEMFCNYLEMSGLGQIYNSAFNSSKHRDDFFSQVGPIDWLNDMPLTSLTNLECTKVIYAKAAWLELVCANVWAAEECKIKVPEANRTQRTHYHVEIIPDVWVDVYDVIDAWGLANPAYQHLIKKALKPGNRGHKDMMTDAQDIIDSAIRGKELIEKGGDL
jgi:hypothetical protein